MLILPKAVGAVMTAASSHINESLKAARRFDRQFVKDFYYIVCRGFQKTHVWKKLS
jgi:hypothetical protein